MPYSSTSKQVLVHNLSYGNEFYLHVHCHANQTHFHIKGCAPRLVLKRRQLGNGFLYFITGYMCVSSDYSTLVSFPEVNIIMEHFDWSKRSCL